MDSDRDYQQIFRRAGQRWLEGDASALPDFERGIEIALEEDDIPAALAAHQKLLVWKPVDVGLHRRVAHAIASARDRVEHGPGEENRLAAIPLFSGIPREELATLLTLVAPRGTDGAEITLAELGPGDFFGEVALLTRRPRTATVSAITEAELLRLDQRTVEELRRRHPDIDASLSEFHRRRAERTVEALIERMKGLGH
jgi:CRP/FNR family cyclic AMP-dependent transcriptional regulator